MVRRARPDLRWEVDWQDAGQVEGAWPAANVDYPPQDITGRILSAYEDTGGHDPRGIKAEDARTSQLLDGRIRVNNFDGAFTLGKGDTYDGALLIPHLVRVSVGDDPSGRDVYQVGRVEVVDAKESATLSISSSRQWDENPDVEAGMAVNDTPEDLADTALVEALGGGPDLAAPFSSDVPADIYASEAVTVVEKGLLAHLDDAAMIAVGWWWERWDGGIHLQTWVEAADRTAYAVVTDDWRPLSELTESRHMPGLVRNTAEAVIGTGTAFEWRVSATAGVPHSGGSVPFWFRYLLASDTDTWNDATSVGWVNEADNPFARYRYWDTVAPDEGDTISLGNALLPGATVAGEADSRTGPTATGYQWDFRVWLTGRVGRVDFTGHARVGYTSGTDVRPVIEDNSVSRYGTRRLPTQLEDGRIDGQHVTVQALPWTGSLTLPALVTLGSVPVGAGRLRAILPHTIRHGDLLELDISAIEGAFAGLVVGRRLDYRGNRDPYLFLDVVGGGCPGAGRGDCPRPWCGTVGQSWSAIRSR